MGSHFFVVLVIITRRAGKLGRAPKSLSFHILYDLNSTDGARYLAH
jgi:hypothetical protein